MKNSIITLEHPRVVQISAAVLMMIPLMDFVILRQTGNRLFETFDWFLIFLGGASLLVPHKSAWFFGMTLCLSFVINTAYTILTQYESLDPFLGTLKLMDCLLVFFIVMTVFYFFRYPYLDRRQHWFAPTGDRFAASTPVKVEGIETQTVDLSYTGSRIVLPPELSFEVGELLLLQFLDINDISCKGRVLESSPGYLRVEFQGLTTGNQDLMRQWLQSQNFPKL